MYCRLTQHGEYRIESLKLHAQYPELQAAPLTGETAKIEVEVTPREIPERRVFDMTVRYFMLFNRIVP
jgi:hypothetical protein